MGVHDCGILRFVLVGFVLVPSISANLHIEDAFYPDTLKDPKNGPPPPPNMNPLLQ